MGERVPFLGLSPLGLSPLGLRSSSIAQYE